jgi:16S rRNA (guanine527-N7)-methyltransferase
MSASNALISVLERGRSLGFLGPGPLRAQVAHARGFAVGHGIAPPVRFLDLGSGGGLPGLVLAQHWSSSEAVLLDAAERRCAFLVESVQRLGLEDRVRIVRARAENAARQPDLRGSFDVVVARGFGPPGVTAECGAPFLGVGGRLLVSEPPDGNDAQGTGRWPENGLGRLGLAVDRSWNEPFHYRSFVLQRQCPEEFPRRVGIPMKRPLF